MFYAVLSAGAGLLAPQKVCSTLTTSVYVAAHSYSFSSHFRKQLVTPERVFSQDTVVKANGNKLQPPCLSSVVSMAKDKKLIEYVLIQSGLGTS